MKKLRWGLVGCGDISQKRVAPAMRDLDNSELIAVNRERYELAEGFAKQFGAQRWYRNWQELVESEEIDAVYVATPVYLHAQQTIAAAEAGKHVLCEKPMAMNVAECDSMIIACRKNGVKLGVTYYRHFYQVVNRIKEIISADEIGKVIIVQINAFERFNPSPGQPRYWFVEKEKAGGGPMFDFGCHRIEVLLNIFGPIKRTAGYVCNVLFDREVDDTATALFQFARGGRAILITTHAAIEPQDTLSIFGSEGSIHVPVLNKGRMHLKNSRGERVEDLPPHLNLHQPLVEDFADSVLSNREPKVNGTIGREVARIEAEIYSDNGL
jgi:predicted dehydrogenase